MTNVKIYHNPSCGTSRNVLQALLNAGIEPEIIEYLKIPPSRTELENITKHIPVRELLRAKESKYGELGLDDAKWSDEQLIDFILEHPILMNRPVVVTDTSIKLCRPAETICGLIPEADMSFADAKNVCEI